jgi:hypothetical protein
VLHDYAERGGNLSNVHHQLGPHGMSVVNAVSSDKQRIVTGNGPLEHMKRVLNHPAMTTKLKNDVVLLKTSDRLDNLQRRHANGGIGKGYASKSKELIKHLFHHYSGDPSHLHPLRKKLADLGVHVSKKHIGTMASKNPV